MENVTKALLISAAILVVILIITFGIRILNSTSEVAKNSQNAGNIINDNTKTAAQLLGDALNNNGTQQENDIKVNKIILSKTNMNADDDYVMKNGRAYIYYISVKNIMPSNATNKQIIWKLNSDVQHNINVEATDDTSIRFVIYEEDMADWGIVEIVAEAQDGSNVKGICYFDTRGFCFLENTKVLTEKGLCKIQDIKVGTKVYTKNEITGKMELKKVLNVFNNNVNKNICKIFLKNDVIESTPNHKYYEKTKGWIEARKLQINDILINNEGKEVKILNFKYIRNNKTYTVYNLNIEDNHNFYVGEDKVLVHNASKPDC